MVGIRLYPVRCSCICTLMRLSDDTVHPIHFAFCLPAGVYKYLGAITNHTTVAVHMHERLEPSRIQTLNVVMTSRNEYGKLLESCVPMTSIALGSEGRMIASPYPGISEALPQCLKKFIVLCHRFCSRRVFAGGHRCRVPSRGSWTG